MGQAGDDEEKDLSTCLFPQFGVAFCGCPCNKSATIWGLYQGPLIFEKNHVAVELLVDMNLLRGGFWVLRYQRSSGYLEV